MAIAPVNNPQPGPINEFLPEELTIKIFAEFTAVELAGKIMLVSRAWNRMALDHCLWSASKLKEFNCNVIDEAIWRQHIPQIGSAEGISFEGLQPLDYRLAIIKVVKFYASLKAAGTSIEDGQGMTILSIPKGLSINSFLTVFGDRIRSIGDGSLVTEFMEVKADKAYRVIMTKNVLSGSRVKSIDDQLALVGRTGCFLPKVFEAMALMFLTEKSSSICLFGVNPWTYTRCYEGILWPFIVGGFAPAGLHVRYNNKATEFDGVAGLRKF